MTEESSTENAGDCPDPETARSTPAETAAPILELDEVFAGLEHPRRRYLLYTLVNGSNEAPLPELAANIAAWEQEKPVGEVTDEAWRDVYVSLYHCHVPKLSELGILSYQEEENIIVRAVNTEQVQAVLDGAGAELDGRQEAHARGTERENPDR